MLRGLFERLFAGDFTGAQTDVERMAAIHAGINKADGTGLPSYKAHAERVISQNPALTKRQKEKLLALLKELPDGNAICHGDIHPNNIYPSEQYTCFRRRGVDGNRLAGGHKGQPLRRCEPHVCKYVPIRRFFRFCGACAGFLGAI